MQLLGSRSHQEAPADRRWLVLGDEHARIRTWFEGLGVSPKAMIVCRWHLRNRRYEDVSAVGGCKDRRRAVEKERLGRLWQGRVDAAVKRREGASQSARYPRAVEELIAYLEERCEFLPHCQRRQPSSLGRLEQLPVGIGPIDDRLGPAARPVASDPAPAINSPAIDGLVRKVQSIKPGSLGRSWYRVDSPTRSVRPIVRHAPWSDRIGTMTTGQKNG